MEKSIQNFIFQKKWQIPRHVLFWCFMYLDELLSFFGITPPLELTQLLVLEIVLDFMVVYLNLYWLLPRYLLKRKYIPYIVGSGLSLLVSIAINHWAGSVYYEYDNVLSVHLGTILFTLSVLGTAVAIKLAKYSLQQTQLREKVESEKIKTELTYLKQQVNPHFLFNVLNSLYIQSKTDKDSVPETVMRLSDLLRYQIYDSSENEYVSLVKEIEFLKNYLELESIRREALHIQWSVDGSPEGKAIEPLIFLPLIENAVKHSRQLDGEGEFIKVSWHVDNETARLAVDNNMGKNGKSEIGGFGLENLKRRLELVYPGKHVLKLVSKDGIFKAELSIKPNEVHNN